MELITNDYVIGVHQDPANIPAAAWDALLAAAPHPTPFMRHAYLAALHNSGSATADTGWQALFVTLSTASGELRAACPLYLKTHSYGEYVFDWAWAQAYEQHGLNYYPKAVIAVPFTPVPGSRLLASSPADAAALLQAVRGVAQESGCSSVHLLFGAEADMQSCAAQAWLQRDGVQFHFENRRPDGLPYTDFDDLLAHMQQDKRKKIRQERRKVADAGVRYTLREGRDIRGEDWALFYQCYERTYLEHGNRPYLSPAFFDAMRHTLPEHWLMVIAERDGAALATSLIGIDPARRTAFGRYWGALQHLDCLHFETCYYQPLQWCLANGYQRFEGGAQGEHKMARALLPTPTASAHWVAHPAFRDAIERFLDRESDGVQAYRQHLAQRSPLKSPASAT